MTTTKIPAELVAVNAIQGTLIADNAITSVHIAQNNITTTQIATNNITSEAIAQNNVTAVHILQNTITVTHLADSAVETAKINADAVTGAKLADNAVDSEHYTDGSIDTAHIGDLQVTAAKIGANAVTLAKMASLTRGSILIGNSAADVAALAIGSNGTALVSDGTDISWGSAGETNRLPLAGGTMTGNITIDSAGSAGLTLDRASTSTGSTVDFKTAGTLKWYMGLRGLTNDNWYLRDEVGSTNALTVTSGGNLTVAGTLGVTGVLTASAGVTTAANQRVQSSSGMLFLTGASAIPFEVGAGSEKMRLTSTGLGIGTTSPDTPLHVVGANGLLLDTDGGGDGSVYFGHISGSDRSYIARSSDDFLIWNIASGNTRFGVGNAEKVRIDSNGNVGIGITTPNESGFGATSNVLSIAGTAQDAFGVLELISTDVTSSNRIGEIRFGNLDAGSSFASNAGIRATRDGADNSSALSLWTTNAGTFAEHLSINAAGDIVIGATSKIYSSGDTDSYLQFNQANTLRAVIGDSTRMIINTGETVFNDDHGNFDFRIESDGNTNMFWVDASSNAIAIGSDNLLTTLHVDAADNELTMNVSSGLSSNSTWNGIGFGARNSMKSAIIHQRTTSYSRGALLFCLNDDGDTSHADNSDERMRIKNDGNIVIGNTGTPAQVGKLNTSGGITQAAFYVGNTGFDSKAMIIGVEGTGDNAGYNFAEYVSGRRFDNSSGDLEFKFRGDGNAYADASWNASGADYAEYFEWSDGNASSQDRIGLSVVLDGNKIREATGSDAAGTIIGVISGNAAVVGDTSFDKWTSKYEKDDYGRYVHENYVDENGDTLKRRKLNASYDDSLTYVEREKRKEWDTVGLMGKLRMKKGQQTGTNWIKMRDISASVEEWLVR